MSHFLTISDYEPEQIQFFLDYSTELHKQPSDELTGKNIAFVFEKPSLRTKVGTEAAINHLGGNVIHIDSDILLSSGKAIPFTSRESLKDAMKNVSLWCDALFARVYSHQTLKDMAENSSIPIINALCDKHHPMQALADLYTLQQNFGTDTELKVSFVGDANNVAFSLIEILLKFGHTVHFSGPESYSWSDDHLRYFALLSVQYKGTFTVFSDPVEAVKHTDAVYTDTFISMGEEHLYDEKIGHFEPFQVNAELFSYAKPTAGFMHCLPAHRGVEVTDEVIDHENSWVYQQAENRMIVSKGVFAGLLSGKPLKDRISAEELPVVS
ncbi:MAG: ornithine carbamoyltransferase [Gracilimonas sp.]|nr:ornithine carbamoyltransferase [Gracilimonas sp.]